LIHDFDLTSGERQRSGGVGYYSQLDWLASL